MTFNLKTSVSRDEETPDRRRKTDDRERCIYLAQPSKVELFLKVILSEMLTFVKWRCAEKLDSPLLTRKIDEFWVERQKSVSMGVLLPLIVAKPENASVSYRVVRLIAAHVATSEKTGSEDGSQLVGVEPGFHSHSIGLRRFAVRLCILTYSR